jgi:hypothetical protein
MIPPAIILPVIDLVLDKITNPGKEREATKTIAAEILADEKQIRPLYQAIDRMNEQQVALNQIAAASDHIWQSGWRPAAGWICIVALGWHYLLEPVLASVLIICGLNVPPLPRADFNDLWTLLLALLGMSGLRSIDKKTRTPSAGKDDNR